MPAPIRTQRAVDLAAAHIRSSILSGEYPTDSWLPAERALAESLGISRLTLRAALARLESEQLVRPEQGSGVRVLDFRHTAGLEVLEHLVLQPIADHSDSAASFLELRRVVAAEAVARACARCQSDGPEIERLEQLAHQQQRELSLEAFAERDRLFARQTISCAGSLAMQLLLNSVERVVRHTPALLVAMYTNIDAVRASYAQIIALIRAGDPPRARAEVRGLLETMDQATLAALAAAGPSSAPLGAHGTF